MKKGKSFSVTNPLITFKLGLFIIGFFIILIILNTIFSEPPHYPMYITITLFVFIPVSLVTSWSGLYKVTVNGQKITVRRGLGLKYYLDVSEITSVDWKIVLTTMGKNEIITVRTPSNRFSIEVLMVGFEKMAEYISENVDESKIKIHIKDTINKNYKNPEVEMLKKLWRGEEVVCPKCGNGILTHLHKEPKKSDCNWKCTICDEIYKI